MADFDILKPARRFGAAFLDDPVGTLLRGTDNGQRIPVSKTVTSYALTIHATVGLRRGVVGAIHEISTAQTLAIDEEYEIDALARGFPRELIPQIVSGRTITVQRYDLYRSTLEQVFGEPELVTLADQTGPLSLRLTWRAPEPSSIVGAFVRDPASQLSVFEFSNVYIQNLGRTISMNNVIVGSNATF